jgi:hypothetical protein
LPVLRCARRAFGLSVRQVYVDTTSFAVTGAYAPDLDAHTLAVTYGYSRAHRTNLKQWMLAVATTRQGDVPRFCQALDGNASDKVRLVYCLAEHRLRQQLAVTGQTIPSQVNKPTDHPTMRWVFQCFEGVDLLHIRHGPDVALTWP